MGYVVERATNNSGRWIRITKSELRLPTLYIGDLIEGTTYEYRVIAVNKKGESQPSESSEPFACKEPFSKDTMISPNSTNLESQSRTHDSV